jgi:hypothetical protein
MLKQLIFYKHDYYFCKKYKIKRYYKMGCGKKFKEKFYDVIKIKDGKVQNATDVDLVTIPNIPVAGSNLRLFNLSDKTFTKEYSNRKLFLQRYQVKQYNSESFLISTNFQIYEKDTNSTLLFTTIDILNSFIYIIPDGKYTGTITGATGRFEGATKLVWEVYTHPKTKEKQITYTVTGYRPKC